MTSAFRDWLFKPPYKGVPWIVWCYVALSCLVVTTGGVYKGELTGFDDPVRMTQVLNWVNGAGWYDRTITRVNAPDGFTSIWSRLVDIPIALVILIAQQFVAQKKAALIASVVIPFTELALLFPVMRYFARPLVGKKDAWLVVLFLLFTTVTNFNPFSVAGFHTGEASHHSWYVILDLLMFGAVARIALGVIGSSPALMMGGAAGGLLAVGIEGLPMIAGSVLLLGGLGWYCNRPALPQRGMQALIYATLLGLILLPVHQPPGNILGISFAEPSLLGPILTACAAIFLGIELNVLKLVGRNHFVSLLALLVIGIMIGLGLLFAFPEILDGPAAGLTPDERILVFKEHAESWPLYKIALSPLNYIALSMPCILALISGLVAVAKAPTHRRRTLYLSYLGFAVLAGGLGQYISRFYHHALTTACPWLLWLWQRVRDRVVQTPKRCLILFAAFIAIGPLWMLIIPAFETHVLILKQLFLFPAKQQMLAAPCNIVPFGDYLNAHYSKDTKIIVPGADSSRMLYYSDLKIDFLNNYPSQNKFIDNQIFFGTQDQSMSKAIAIAHGFDLIAICPATMKPAPLAAGEEPMMFERMQLGPLPIWLKPVNTGLPGSYLLFQVDKTELMK